jgi:hypothetical protein
MPVVFDMVQSVAFFWLSYHMAKIRQVYTRRGFDFSSSSPPCEKRDSWKSGAGRYMLAVRVL